MEVQAVPVPEPGCGSVTGSGLLAGAGAGGTGLYCCAPVICDTGPELACPLRTSVILVNRPAAGAVRVTVAVTGVVEPSAQSGTQP
jgi:hypothetical protein